jgi:hypothetical protein
VFLIGGEEGLWRSTLYILKLKTPISAKINNLSMYYVCFVRKKLFAE